MTHTRSRYDALAEYHAQRALRALPRHHAVEGPFNAEPDSGTAGLVVAVIAFLATAVAVGYAWGILG